MAENDSQSLTDEYLARKVKYQELCNEVEFTLKRKLDESGIKWHTVSSRVKDIGSFLEKIDRKEYADPFAQTDDLAGIRVVCLFMLDLDRVGDILSSSFRVLHREDKINESEPSAFGYMSHHYICQLADRYSGERYDDIKGVKFEVQVRTILMDAWANMSHYLSYKNEQSIPQGLVKDFHALSGLLYVADRQFESLYKASSRSAADAVEKVLHSSELREYEVNADTVAALLEKVFPDRRPGTADAISEFTSELRVVGFLDLAEVERILRDNHHRALADERRAPPRTDKREGEPQRVTIYTRVGLARTALDIHSEKFKEYRRELARRRKEEKRRQ
ncbi:GTP pyrophosphokinase family protein [Streptomyces echinatus]|uniref:GTP pyrophosphokinase family protein n=1 Tax=Streptomyces echinatus TaxID=67293 RepID=UPI00379193CA